MRRREMLLVTLALLVAWIFTGCASARRDWEVARRVDEIQAYDWFLELHPRAEQAPQARHRRELLQRDQPAWEQATREGTVEAYERFASQHGDSPYAERARNIIAEWRQDEAGRDIVDALAQGKVQVEATGSGRFLLVNLRMRRTIDRPLRVVVPPGTFFACRGSAQNMIALAEASVNLDDGEWQALEVLTACVDLLKNVPQPSDTFIIQRLVHQMDLRRLMEVLCRDAWPSCVKPRDNEQALRAAQAAIWIVAGDATYERLGVLRRNPRVLGFEIRTSGEMTALNPRSIDETDTAMAMRLVHEAGIDIKSKTIWRDRQLIAPGVSNTPLRNWLEQR